ncbi:MAG: aminoacyl-tRNA hydrolase [Candidatus Omnitrophota bacterium]|jgi:PTH1 family peptidyl-tRNA hydrolase|nr:MAG: aminoacyl-tRNA hydrolase [Candidatus Omnitrophota bacterium]
MKLILGLGNPGIRYSGSRHNIGFQVIRTLAKQHKMRLKKEPGIPAFIAKGNISSVSVILAMPLTFMNLSGVAAKLLFKKFALCNKDLLAVCDDLDLDFGRIKLVAGGSSAGHNGIKSIITYLETAEFNRLRIGIGRPDKDIAAKYVLSSFDRAQKKELPEIIGSACSCCESWVINGISETMNIYNKRRN